MAVDDELRMASPRPGPAATTARDLVTHGPVHLDVTDLGGSLAFWHEVIGLEVRGGEESELSLGVADSDLLVLHPGAARRGRRGHSGLYHLAIHLPSEMEFARVLARLLTRRVPNAPTDHIMHWATYLSDPDGIGLELSFETLDRFGHLAEAGRGAGIVDSDGRLRRGTEPLDLAEVFSYLADHDFDRPLPPGTRIGHVHLHVASIEPALSFYETLGFERNMNLETIGMADMHAAGGFPHRLALNTWQGIGAPQPPPGTAGLRHLTLRLRSQDAVEAALARWPAADDRVVRDPSGNRVLLAGPAR